MVQSVGEVRTARDSLDVGVTPTSTTQDATEKGSLRSPNGYQNLVFTDPIAFRYLREDSCTRVVETRVELEGFVLYLVEQWACSRSHPTFVISTFTGQSQHKVIAGVLAVPIDEKEWSTRLRLYLKAVSTFHARRKDTSLGVVMVTNLSSFPSALTVIQVPSGDLKEYREMFIVNEDLKRLGCSGRAGLTLSAPSGATKAKFLQLYHTHESLQVQSAVIELVRLCQVSLVMYDKLAPEYADGLLCDVTEAAISDWWAKIGTEFFSIEPSDGILGPTTAAALLGLYVGARNRLGAFGAPAVKDAFDIKGMKRAIAYFQRANKLTGVKPRRLDLTTLQRLHRSTSKAAHSERWAVPRAVKSTVQEYGGKGGEMVIGMVGRDRAGIAEVETLDMEKFSQKVSGDHGRWLWQGKSKKAPTLDLFGGLAADNEGVFSGDEKIPSSGPFRRKEAGQEVKPSNKDQTDTIYSNPLLGSQSSLETSDKDPALHRAVLKNVTGKMSDARTGLGKFRDAVGISSRRGHQQRLSRDQGFDSKQDGGFEGSTSAPRTHESTPERSGGNTGPQKPLSLLSSPDKSGLFDVEKSTKLTKPAPDLANVSRGSINDVEKPLSSGSSLVFSQTASEDLGKSATGYPDQTEQKAKAAYIPELRPTRSADELRSLDEQLIDRREAPKFPRQISTSAVESVSTWLDALENNQSSLENGASPSQAMSEELRLAVRSQQALAELRRMSEKTNPVLEARLQDLKGLEGRLRQEYEKLSYAYAEKLKDHRAIQDGTSELLAEEDSFLTDSFKELETLGAKLEYELGSLVSKVEDVEDGVADFERQVEDLEARISSLEQVEVRKERWPLNVLSRWGLHI